MKGWLKSSWASVLLLAILAVALVGCGEGTNKEGQPIKEGDYTTEPGNASQSKN